MTDEVKTMFRKAAALERHFKENCLLCLNESNSHRPFLSDPSHGEWRTAPGVEDNADRLFLKEERKSLMTFAVIAASGPISRQEL